MSQLDIPLNTLYVVSVHPNKDHIKLQCIGMNCVDNTLKDSYDHWVESYYVYDKLSKGTWANAWIRR